MLFRNLLNFISGILQNVIANIVIIILSGVFLWMGLGEVSSSLSIKNILLWMGSLIFIICLMISSRFILAWICEVYKEWTLPVVSKDNLGILIARIEDDDDDVIRDSIRNAILFDLKYRTEILYFPKTFRIDESNYEKAKFHILNKGKNWLFEKNCELLIWGKVKKEKIVTLQFLFKDDVLFVPVSFKLTEKLELSNDFLMIFLNILTSRLICLKRHSQLNINLDRYFENIRNLECISDLPLVLNRQVQLSKAIVLMELSESKDDERHITQAVEILTGLHRSTSPSTQLLEWMEVSGLLGKALTYQARFSSSPLPVYKEALFLFEKVLDIQVEESFYACDNWNSYIVLAVEISDYEHNLEVLERAISLVQKMLVEVVSNEKSLIRYYLPRILHNYACLLDRISDRTNDIVTLEKSARLLEAVLESHGRRIFDSRGWANTLSMLTDIFRKLGERSDRTSLLISSVKYGELAVKSLSNDKKSAEYLVANINLGIALTHLASRTKNVKNASRARDCLNIADRCISGESSYSDQLKIKINLINCLVVLGQLKSDYSLIKEAEEVGKKALRQLEGNQFQKHFAMLNFNTGAAVWLQGRYFKNVIMLESALSYFEKALVAYETIGEAFYVGSTKDAMENVKKLIIQLKNYR